MFVLNWRGRNRRKHQNKKTTICIQCKRSFAYRNLQNNSSKSKQYPQETKKITLNFILIKYENFLKHETHDVNKQVSFDKARKQST